MNNGKPIVLASDTPAAEDRLGTSREHRDISREQIEELDAAGYSGSHDLHLVYFPWRDTTVTMVGPRAHRWLLSSRNRNKITDTEQRRLGRATIAIAGLSVGSQVALTLAMEGVGGQLRLADPDTLAVSNLNRLSGSLLDVARNKATLTARRIWEINPYQDIRLFPGGVTPGNRNEFLQGSDLLVEETDDLVTKITLRQAAKQRRIPVVMDTNDRGMLDIERFDSDPAYPILHGLVPGVEGRDFDAEPPSTSERQEMLYGLAEFSKLSPRMQESFPLIGRELASWPQLAEDVMIGAGITTAAVRAIILGEPAPSGRWRFDVNTRIASGGME